LICGEDVGSLWTLCKFMYDTVPEVGEQLEKGEWTFFGKYLYWVVEILVIVSLSVFQMEALPHLLTYSVRC